MLKKKHSQITTHHHRPLSPLRKTSKVSPVALPIHNHNLSPMRQRSKTPTGHRKVLNRALTTVLKSPRQKQNTFQSKIQSLITDFSCNYGQKSPQASSRIMNPGNGAHEEVCFGNLGLLSRQNPSKRGIKESKGLFGKCISEMNSEKKKVSDNSNGVIPADTNNAASFKALKIQMIESVLPEDKNNSDKKMPFMELRKTESQMVRPKAFQTEKVREIKDFQVEDQPEKTSQKQSFINLINQSFSSVKPPLCNEEQQIRVLPEGNLQERAKLMQSVYEQGISDYTDFDNLLSKIQIKQSRNVEKLPFESVKMSLQSIDDGLSMNPYL